MKDIVSIVPAKYDDIFEVFAESFLETLGSKMIVVDDGLTGHIKNKYSEFTYIESPKPFGFSKSVNAGIKAAGDSDVIVWNDDCYIHTVNTDLKLAEVAYAEEIIKKDIKVHSHSLRDFRNYIHPREQVTSGFSPDNLTVKINWQVLKAVISQLSKWKKE